MTTDTKVVKGHVWQEDDDHNNGGYEVAAYVEPYFANQEPEEYAFTVARSTDEIVTTFYMDRSQATELVIALAALLAK